MRPSQDYKSGYLPALDGLRAIAIGGVLLTHDLPWTIAGHTNAAWKGFGGWGVQLFFSISGVLICWRLLEDEQKRGKIQLRSFYVRRLFRIQPAALTYLFAIALLFFFGVMRAGWGYWCSAAFSYANFLVTESTPPGSAALLGHFWTLAVEEHFYIILSLLFFLTRKNRILMLSTGLVLLFSWQAYATEKGYFSPQVSPRRTYWIIQLLLIPALFALLLRLPKVRRFAERYLEPWTAVAVTLLLMLIHEWSIDPGHFGAWARQLLVMNFLIVNRNIAFAGFALFVIAAMLHPKSISTRFLELPPLRFVGRLSYSIYLWHVLFFIPVYLGDLVHSPRLELLAERPWKYIATAVMALASYFLIERPMIRLGHKIAPPATSGHADVAVVPREQPLTA